MYVKISKDYFYLQRYEDLEFQLMEGEAHTEAEKEEILQEIRFLESEIQKHEEKLNEIDLIQTHLLSHEFKHKQEFELLKRSLTRSIQEESDKLVELNTYEMISTSSSDNDLTKIDRNHVNQTEASTVVKFEIDFLYLSKFNLVLKYT